MVKKIVMVMLLPTTIMAHAYAGSANDTLRTKVYYQTGNSLVDLSFMDNAANLKRLKDGIKSMGDNPNVELKHIKIRTATSPEGNPAFNKKLARKRGESLRDYLKQNLALSDDMFIISDVGEDWEGLTQMIAEEDLPWANRAIHIIQNTPEWIFRNRRIVDGRKRQLQNLYGGRAWKYMLANYFGSLRAATVIVCEVTSNPPAAQPAAPPAASPVEPSPAPSPENKVDTIVAPPEIKVDTIIEKKVEIVKPNKYYALKTNLLYDALFVPNIGIETNVGGGWTLGASGMLAWWSKDASHKYWRIYGGELDVNKYFGAKAKEKPLQGHHVSLYGQFLSYDIERGGTGYQGKQAFGVGLGYGYSLPIGRRLNLDFGLGIGYFYSRYKTYEPFDGCYVYQETKERQWIGPTRASVSLVWLLGNGNENSKKAKKEVKND